MKNLIKLTDLSVGEIEKLYTLVDGIKAGEYRDLLKDKTVVLFFPESSIRTRVTFEKGVRLLGGQTILFPPETLDKREDPADVMGYLNNWADLVIVRHKKIEVIEALAESAHVPVINAMTSINHPCEILTDLYALSKIRKDFKKDNFLFVGTDGNIGRTWAEASALFGFSLEQCCAKGYELPGIKTYDNIEEAIAGKDIVCTDSLPSEALAVFEKCRVTKEIMDKANDGAILNPCPPFYRGEEVSADVIASDYFAGYGFKKHLLEVQQAIMAYCLME
ncbi:MAG: peptide transporter [Lachnospiraceae bacterium]|nr:peptide transporter [Lachnospiraceae bacterium]